jgi:hypothetical protein
VVKECWCRSRICNAGPFCYAVSSKGWARVPMTKALWINVHTAVLGASMCILFAWCALCSMRLIIAARHTGTIPSYPLSHRWQRRCLWDLWYVEVYASNTRPLYILFVLLSTLPLVATWTLFSYLTYLAYNDLMHPIFVPKAEMCVSIFTHLFLLLISYVVNCSR